MLSGERRSKAQFQRPAAQASEDAEGETSLGLEDSCSSTSDSYLLYPLSRTSMVLLDYKQFKAARSIQRTWRRYNYWEKFRNQTQAAITIQRWWRGFSVRNNYNRFLENMLQARAVRHYHDSASKIQALWRGWRSRQTVHDNSKLRRLQVCAAEDLLNCVAFKLHHLLRTYAIPGVYSLKNSNCMSRIEKLLASLHFRFHNGQIKSQIARDVAAKKAEEKNFLKSNRFTNCRYPGHTQYWSQCKPECDATLKLAKDMDRRMYRIIEMYDASQIKAQAALRQKLLKYKKEKNLLENIRKMEEKSKRDFCGDVIASMRRWNILVENKIQVDKNIFKHPEKLERFFEEISELAKESENCSCYCNIPVFDEIYCG